MKSTMQNNAAFSIFKNAILMPSRLAIYSAFIAGTMVAGHAQADNMADNMADTMNNDTDVTLAGVTEAGDITVVAQYEERRAVEQSNLQLGLETGMIGDHYLTTGSVSVSDTLPFNNLLGFQLTGMGGMLLEEDATYNLDNSEFSYIAGGQGRLFWRDQTFGMAGLKASFVTTEDVADIARVSAEGAYYFDYATIGAELGYQFDNVTDKGAAPFVEAGITAYPADWASVDLSVGGILYDDETHVRVAQNNAIERISFEDDVYADMTLEASLWDTGATAYVTGSVARNGDDSAGLGLTWKFGAPNKELKLSDRHDHLRHTMLSDLKTAEMIVRSGAVKKHQKGSVPEECDVFGDTLISPVEDILACDLLGPLFEGAPLTAD